MKIEAIELDNSQTMFVEVLDIDISEEVMAKMRERVTSNSEISDLPEGSDQIGMMDDIKISMELLKDDLSSIATTVKESFKKNQPDEFSVELSFGFAGKFAIPYITSAQSNGAIKVKATWKKE